MSAPIPKGEVINGNLAKELDSRFLNANWFLNRGTVGLTVDRIERHAEFKFENGNKIENAKFCYFKEIDKPLNLCDTNIKSLMVMAESNDPKDIYGKTFGFCAKKEKHFGEDMFCVRVDHKYKPKVKESK